jgi:UDP-N-acetylglucosamine 4-epimerase
MHTYEEQLERIKSRPRTWLVTGAAGFIGSHLAESLLKLGQTVIGLDNFSTGKPKNLFYIRDSVGETRWKSFRFLEGDIRRPGDCREACREAELVLHEAALGSVPRSIDDPIATTDNNVMGFVNMLVAARDAGVSRFVYASSSAVFGDHPAMPKVEPHIGKAVSPYGLSKHVNELYAEVFARCYGFDSIGLRYFNVFGPRQDANGALS